MGDSHSVDKSDDQSVDDADSKTADLEKRLKETSSEAKKYRQTNAELKAQLDAIEKEKLESQGKFQEMHKKEKERAESLEKKLKETTGTYALKVINSQVKAEAAKLGCIDNDALLALMNLKELEVSDDFEVDETSMKTALEKMAKEKPYLFQKQAPGVRDLPPKSDKSSSFKGKAVSEMTLAEKLAALEANLKRGT